MILIMHVNNNDYNTSNENNTTNNNDKPVSVN